MSAPSTRLGLLAIAAAIGLACGLGAPTQGTTRLCPAVDEGDLCFQQCGDPEEPACVVVDQDAEEVAECARDGVTKQYLRMDDDYVLPAGETRCFVVLDDDGSNADAFDDAPADCESFGLLVVAPDGLEDDDCFDFTCALGPSESCS